MPKANILLYKLQITLAERKKYRENVQREKKVREKKISSENKYARQYESRRKWKKCIEIENETENCYKIYIRITKIAENIGKTHLVLWNKITVARVEKKTTDTRDEYPCEDVRKIAQCIVGRWKPYKWHGSYSNEKRNNFNALFSTSNILCKWARTKSSRETSKHTKIQCKT